ncbi:MAG: hypothetical protein OEW97_00660 [Gammaproteobacteria bacterium]|nr:hypothetical protein [Gammaproteobacteria bacterium]
MALGDVFMIVPGSPAISSAIWFVILTVVLYLARSHAHAGILSFSNAIHNGLRLTARSLKLMQNTLKIRNRDVLLAQGRESTERIIEREFERIDATVRKDLADYPALHRHLSEEITAIDDNYKDSTEVPPAPPAWVKAVEAVAKIPTVKGDPTVGNILEDIHQSLVKSSTRALEDFRKASHKRHQILQKMMPHWRTVLKVLQEVDKSVNSLLARSVTIDRLMHDYEDILKGTDKALRMLSSSSMTQFFISGFVLAIAVGGAIINFNLIARPMSEMVGGTNMLMGFKASSIAALVIILVEISLGLFLMESLRITRLFPVIGSLNDKMRIKMVWITFIFLFALASVEAGLAYMREILMQDAAATRALLRDDGGVEMVENSHLWITTAAQMGLGFILPFALTFVAIPLESFIHSMRTVLGTIMVALLRAIEWLLRFTGNLVRSAGKIMIHIYDFLIFLPLGFEKLIKNKGENDSSKIIVESK